MDNNQKIKRTLKIIFLLEWLLIAIAVFFLYKVLFTGDRSNWDMLTGFVEIVFILYILELPIGFYKKKLKKALV